MISENSAKKETRINGRVCEATGSNLSQQLSQAQMKPHTQQIWYKTQKVFICFFFQLKRLLQVNLYLSNFPFMHKF